MDHKKFREELEAHQDDPDELFQMATGLLAGQQETEKKLRRLIEISRPAPGMEDEWNHTVQAITG